MRDTPSTSPGAPLLRTGARVRLACAAGIGVLFLVPALALYAPILDAFFLHDDLMLLAQRTQLGGATLLDCWRPLPNGFWRPLPTSLVHLLVTCFGANPLAFHLPVVLLHVGNALLLRRVALNLGWTPLGATACGLFFLCTFAAWPAVGVMQNVMDVMLGTALLLVLLAADAAGRRLARPWALSLVVISAYLCKETALVVPASMVVWWTATRCAQGRLRRQEAVRTLGPAVAFGAVLTLLAVARQVAGQSSYLAEGRLVLAPRQFAHQCGDLMLSIFFPWVHVAEFFPAPLRLSELTLWLLRASVGGLVAAAALRGLASGCRRGEDADAARRSGALAAIAFLVVTPAALLPPPPEGRFLYSALAPACLFAGAFLRRSAGPVRLLLGGIAAILTILSLASFAWSPEVAGHVRSATEVEAFVAACRREAAGWRDGDIVAIFDHPHPGDPLATWPVRQAIFDTLVPGARVRLAVEALPPGTRHAYRWGGGRLARLPVTPPLTGAPSPATAR